MGTVTRLTNKKRLELIEKRAFRDQKKKDPERLFLNPGPVVEEVIRQLMEAERLKTETISAEAESEKPEQGT